MLLYHHCRASGNISHGEIRPNPRSPAPGFKKAYLWLQNQVGFYPLFVAVGATENDLRLTGYQDNWWNKSHRYTYRSNRKFTNGVLFSFAEVRGIFMDFLEWHISINDANGNREVSDYDKRLIFKPSWSRSRWLAHARGGRPVQLVVPRLYLPDAKRIWVKDKITRAQMERLGFDGIEVKRLSYMSTK